MKKEYQHIISQLLLLYRKEHKITQRKMAKILDISFCQISRMEQGKRSITDQNAQIILDRLDIDLKADEQELDEYSRLLEDFYLAIARSNDQNIKLIHKKLIMVHEKFEPTILCLKYRLYDLIYRIDDNQEINNDEVERLLSLVTMLNDNERISLYDYASIYYRRLGDHNKAIKLSKMAVDIDNDTVNHAIACSHYARILINLHEFSDAKLFLDKAIRIFVNYSINKRALYTRLMIAILYIETRELERAEYILVHIIKSDQISHDDAKVVISNLLWIYGLKKDFINASYLIKYLNRNIDLVSKKAITNIAYLCFLMKDKRTFKRWYDLFIKTYDQDDIDKKIMSIINACFYFDMNDILTIYDQAMDLIDTSENKDEFLMINEMLAEAYIKTADHREACKIYKKLYHIEQGEGIEATHQK